MSATTSWAGQVVLRARCAAIFLPWLAHLFAADLLLSALLPVSVIAPNLTYNISSTIAASVWRGIQLIFTRLNRANIIVSGLEKLPVGESAIVVSNHVQWTDFYMIQELAIARGMLSRCRWFAKQELKWVPLLGTGLWAMGMPLVSRNWTADQGEMNRVFHGIVKRQWPVCKQFPAILDGWLVLKLFAGLIAYSEATRYTKTKRREAEQWCEDNKRPLGEHVLYPRTKGFVACVKNLRQAPHVKAVYDVTVAYAKGDILFQQPPTFFQTILLPRLDREWKFFVHVERFELADLPHGDDELSHWLEDRWIEKGRVLERLRRDLAAGMTWTSSSLSSVSQ